MQNNIFSGLFVGQNLITLKQVDSTNNFLKELLSNSKPVPEGTVIMAEDQFAGRGQQQNRWFAEPGKNLTFSLLLKPTFLPVTQQFDLTRAVSLGVTDALLPILGENLKIKWPNDIYYTNLKLGGMLIENMLQGSVIKNAVAGIGLNINQPDFPLYVPNPVSVKQILQMDYDLKALLSDICKSVEAWYLRLKAGDIAAVRNTYLERLYGFNQKRLFALGGNEVEGIITGVSDQGLLQVDISGATQAFNLKQIQFIH